MADEITITMNISVKNGNFTYDRNLRLVIDQANVGGANPGKVNVGTTSEAISLPDITSAGWCYVQNLDATNFVNWGAAESGSASIMASVGKLKPGEAALFRMDPSTTLRMQADTAACDVLVHVFED